MQIKINKQASNKKEEKVVAIKTTNKKEVLNETKKESKPKPAKPIKEDSVQNDSNGYSAKDIYVLEGLDPVRKRPGMYIGSTGVSGLHHLIWEVFDNSIDEALGGYCDNIKIELLTNNRVSVLDNGRGIPVDYHSQSKKSALETVLTTLHAGGKFGGDSYKISGGLHGVGVSVVNALSSYLKAEVYRDGFLYAQEYSKGKPTSEVTKTKSKEKIEHGTRITFEPDPTIMQEIDFNWKTILDHIREQAYLVRKIKIDLADHRNIDNLLKYTFYFENGIVAFLNYLIRDHETKAVHKNIFYVNDTYENIQVEIALSYVDEIETSELAFANNIHTPEGGMHLTGFRSALTRVLNDYLKKTYSKENLSLTGEDVREGLMVIVSVKIREPQFEGQTKAKLGNPEARVAVDQIMSKAFRDFLEKNPEDVKRILEKCLVSAKARSAAKLARENVLRKSVMEHTTLPGKLADCISRKAENSELFIVEGDSAGGCFSGDTEIALTDGRNVSFEDLVKEYGKGIKNYCYTILKNGNVGVAEIKNPRITNHNTKVVRVTLDNGEEIICTPDHKFMLKNGEYKEAKDLVNTDSLMVKDNILKVKSIQMIDALMDVYDLEVENTHNFALASGVFVHNSAKQGRDRHTQAILPLRGKILNVEKARLDKMMSSEEIKAIILALGTSISEDFNLEKLRYHKIILMSDADVDGAHIRTLLLTLFYRYFLSIIEKGYLYAAQPPLFRVQKGKSFKYAYTEDEKEKIIDEMIKLKDDKKDTKSKKEQELEAESSEEAAGENDEAVEEVSKYKGIIVQRYKGLGEMNPEQLWETTMDPKVRILKQITIDDAKEADRLFDILMGEERMPRKKFIQVYAKKVKNLDV